MSDRERLLKQVQMYSFTAVEINLYLDTHPTDRIALQHFAQNNEKLEAAKREYIRKYGPLRATDFEKGSRWTWVDNPWPWEYECKV
jgi:spore coat protein JB